MVMNQPVEARRWLISGRVQGVGFRWFISRHAERLGISGGAENLPDGRVKVVARGPSEALEELDAALAKGPRLARVENVEKTEIPHDDVPSKGFTTK